MGFFHKEYQNKETDHYKLHIWSYHAYMTLKREYNGQKQSFPDVLQSKYS